MSSIVALVNILDVSFESFLKSSTVVLTHIILQQSCRGEEWGEFLHLPSNRFYDFGAIRKEIEKETERMSGKKHVI